MEQRNIEKLMSGLYGKCFKKRLNDKDFIENIKKILKKKNLDYSIKKDKVGRIYEIDAFIIEIDNRKYIFPLELDLIDKSDHSIHFEASQMGKLIPRGIPNFQVKEFYMAIKDKDDEKYCDLLKRVYSDDVIISIFTDSMHNKSNFKNHYNLIEKSIQNFFCKDYHSAISLLLPCIEGIIRKMNGAGLDLKNDYHREGDFKTTILNQAIAKYAEIFFPCSKYWFPPELKEENKIYYHLDEVFSILNSYCKFLSDFTFMNSKDFFVNYPNENLNRHEILHGYTTDYGTESNWYKLFNMLDFLLFFDGEFTRPQRSINYLKKHLNFNYLSKSLDILNFKIEKTKGDFENYISRMLKNDIQNALKKIEVFKHRVPKEVEESYFKYELLSKIELPIIFNQLSYFKVKDKDNNIIKILFGHPNVYTSRKEKNLLILTIDDENVSETEMKNTHFYAHVDSTNKKLIDLKLINPIN